VQISVGLVDSLGQLGGSQVRGLSEVVPGHQWDAVTRDGSGALGTSGVDGRDVSTSLGFVVCATADGASAVSMTNKPKERKRIVASDAGPS
jgi:hypothetical protein